MTIKWSRFELWVKLDADKPRMIAQLDDLHKLTIRRKAAKNHALAGKHFSICIIEFIPVTMSLGDHFLAIQPAGKTSFSQKTGIRAESHGAAFLHHAFLLIH